MAYDQILHQVFSYFPFLEERVVDYRQCRGFLVKLYTKSDTSYLYDLEKNVLHPIPKDAKNLSKEQFLKIFGITLRNAIHSSGLTQEELSEKTGLPQARISDYLYGRHIPNFYAVYKMAQALDCSLEDLGYVM